MWGGEFHFTSNVRTQKEFEEVCLRISPFAKGIVIRGAVSDAALLERFTELEFVVFEGQRITRLWNISKTPNLRMLTVWMNKNLKTLDGLEAAANLECLQLYGSFSEVAVHKIASFSSIAELEKLKEVVISATEPLDHNIDYLIDLSSLDY